MELELEGDLVGLRRLQESDAEELWAATGNDTNLWKWIWSVEPIPHSVEEMSRLISSRCAQDAQGKRHTFAVVLKSSGQVIGSTSYLNQNDEEKSLEIGSTFYSAPARRTGINTECKYLLLRHAFESLGCQRVLIKADINNATSLTAIARIGAKREGVIRHDRKRRDGSWRDAVYFSVIAPEWPETKALIEKLLSR